MEGRTDSPGVLQDFVPFGAAALLPLNLNHFLLKQGTGTADHLLPLGCYYIYNGDIKALKLVILTTPKWAVVDISDFNYSCYRCWPCFL